MSASALIGRSQQLTRIGGFLDELTGGSTALILEGEMGIGKSLLLRHASDLAAARGYRLLTANPVEAEMPLEFAGLADLLEDVPSGLIDALPEPQRRAIRVAVLRTELPDRPIDARTVATAVLTLIRAAATGVPLVIVVDDLPWLDAPSGRVLSFLLRRIGPVPVGFLTAVRTDLTGTAAPSVADDLHLDRLERVRLGPISIGALRVLLARNPGTSPTRAQLSRLHAVCGGNPLFAMEIVANGGHGIGADLEIPVPDMLRQLIVSRIGKLSAGQRDVLMVCALATEPAPATICSAAKDPSSAEQDLDSVIRNGALSVTAGRLVFAHPLIRTVVAAIARPDERRSAHARLAGIVGRTEARARHLGLASLGADETAATAVEVAAAMAGTRGACDIAAELAALAVARTPPTRPADRCRRMVLEAEYRLQSSDLGGAAELLEAVVREAEPGPSRARFIRLLARCHGYQGAPFSTWKAQLLQALVEAGDDLHEEAMIVQDLGMVASNTGDHQGAIRCATRCMTLAESAGDAELVALVSAGLAWVGFNAGQGVSHDLIAKATAGPPPPTRLSMELRPNVPIGHLLHLSDDLDGARERYEIEYRRAEDEGVETGLPLLLWGLVQTEAYAGNWIRAEQLAERGHQLATDSDSGPALAMMASVRGLVHAYRGRLDDGLADAQQAVTLATAQGLSWLLPIAVQAFGLVHLSVGDAVNAHLSLAPFTPAAPPVIAEPGWWRFLPDEMEALIRIGELDAAEQLLIPFQSRSTELRRGWGMATSGRCHALLLARRGDLVAAQRTIEAALELHQQLPLPFEHARTLLCAGEIHRRARHKGLAQTRLTDAAAIFKHLGALQWLTLTLSEIDRVRHRHATPTGSGELTTAERRVADLVSTGNTTPQVAAKLFMGNRTVEAHLSHIYRKLGVTSRTEMAHALRTSTTLTTP